MTFYLNVPKKEWKRPKWVDTSIQPEQYPQFRKTWEDEDYRENLKIRNSIFRFIVTHFKIDPNDPFSYLKNPICLVGLQSAPMAFELSQWGYQVTLIVRNHDEEKKVMANSKRHAGFVKKMMRYNYYKGIPRHSIVVWMDDDTSIPRDKIPGWLSYLNTRCGTLIAAVKDGHDRSVILNVFPNSKIATKFGDYFLIISY